MKVAYEYSHLGGSEILRVHYPGHEQEIYEIIREVTARKAKGFTTDYARQAVILPYRYEQSVSESLCIPRVR